jgi:hypothetical protein
VPLRCDGGGWLLAGSLTGCEDAMVVGVPDTARMALCSSLVGVRWEHQLIVAVAWHGMCLK